MLNRFDSELSVADEQAVAAFMGRVAGEPLPDQMRVAAANVLWWKAQLLRRWDAERQVTAPLDVAEPIQIAAGLAAAAVIVVWVLPSVVRAFSLIHM